MLRCCTNQRYNAQSSSLSLSYPPGGCVNDGISACCTFTSVEDVDTTAPPAGPQCTVNQDRHKVVYCLILVHPEDRWLFGIKWENRLYTDPMLPFGLRSSAKIFNAVADALEWRLKVVGVPYIYNYLDNFAVLGALGSDECAQAVEKQQSRSSTSHALS